MNEFQGFVVVLPDQETGHREPYQPEYPCGNGCFASFHTVRERAENFLGVMRVAHPEDSDRYVVREAALIVRGSEVPSMVTSHADMLDRLRAIANRGSHELSLQYTNQGVRLCLDKNVVCEINAEYPEDRTTLVRKALDWALQREIERQAYAKECLSRHERDAVQASQGIQVAKDRVHSHDLLVQAFTEDLARLGGK